MEAVLRIYDETPGSARKPAASLRLASERITVGELIRRRVEAEVAAYNDARDDVFQGLVQPSGSEKLLNGFKPRKRRTLDPASQVQAALEGFRNNGFILLYDDRQVEDADELLTVGPDSQAVFIKLVPLVGG